MEGMAAAINEQQRTHAQHVEALESELARLRRDQHGLTLKVADERARRARDMWITMYHCMVDSGVPYRKVS